MPLIRFRRSQPLARWLASAPGFDMPVRVCLRGSEYRLLTPTTKWQPLELPGATRESLEVDTLNFYVGVLVE